MATSLLKSFIEVVNPAAAKAGKNGREPQGCIVFFINSFAATASTNTRNATFKIFHSGLL